MENPNQGGDKSGTDQEPATSPKTLSDLEEDEEISNTSTAGGETGPSPDGQFDEQGEKDKAGPM